MRHHFFITGTDTGVGKTVLSALLCAALDAVYWKPIQTGTLEGSDRMTVMRLAGIGSDRTLDEAYKFVPPVAPDLAARSTLGTINHTLLTLAALHAAELPVHGVVLIGDQNRENRETIERFGHVRVIGEVPRLPNLHRTALIQVFMNHFDRSAFAQ